MDFKIFNLVLLSLASVEARIVPFQGDLKCGIKGPDTQKVHRLGIVGGVSAAPGEFGWQISLQTYGGHECGGSILNERWIATAAHCFDVDSNPAHYEIVAGAWNLTNTAESSQVRVRLEKILAYPHFNPDTADGDFALVKLKTPLPLSDQSKKLMPICLPSAETDLDEYSGQECYATGWGCTYELGPFSPILLKVNVTIVKQQVCKKLYDPSRRITKNMICAADPGKDTCTGDDGGPLICYTKEDGGRWHLIGGSSFGYGCAKAYPGVYARVPTFLSWIQDTIKNY